MESMFRTEGFDVNPLKTSSPNIILSSRSLTLERTLVETTISEKPLTMATPREPERGTVETR